MAESVQRSAACKIRADYRDGDRLYLYGPASNAALYYAKRGMVVPGNVVIGMESARPLPRRGGRADVTERWTGLGTVLARRRTD